MAEQGPSSATHDMRRTRWGHNLMLSRREADGSWSAHIIVQKPVRDGDLVLYLDKDGSTLTYEASHVEWLRDPDDMYRVRLHFRENGSYPPSQAVTE